MPWVRLDERFARHPKVVQAGPLGMAMHVAALCYCNEYLTDGFVPRSVATRLLDLEGVSFSSGGEPLGIGMNAEPDHVIGDLLESGMWEDVKGGYQLHDFHDYQPTKDQVLEERRKKQAAGRAGGKARAKQVLKQVPSSRSSKTSAESKPVPVPVPQEPHVLSTSPNGLADESARSRKLSTAEQIAHDAIEHLQPHITSGKISHFQLYEAATEQAWKVAARAGVDPPSATRAVLGACFEHHRDKKPESSDWSRIGKLVKDFGIESIYGLSEAMAKAETDWFPYARAVCKRRLEEQARAP